MADTNTSTASTGTENYTENNNKPKILLVAPIFPAFESALSPKYQFLKPFESDLPFETFVSTHADSIRAVLTTTPNRAVDSTLLDRLPALGLIAASSTGVNHIDLDACRRRNIAVTNAGRAFSPDAADFAVGLTIDVLRRVTSADQYVRKGLWVSKGDYPLATKVGGKQIGIVGLGSIGSEVAKRLEAFGCTISYYSRSAKPDFPYKYFADVRDLAAESDVLVLSCALTAETHHIINRDVMLALGKNGVIINVGRGALINEKELVRCLMEGVIGGAGLDVFENEPHVPEELFQMENVVLSAHRAVTTPESFKDVLDLVIANLGAFFSNKPLLSPVSY